MPAAILSTARPVAEARIPPMSSHAAGFPRFKVQPRPKRAATGQVALAQVCRMAEVDVLITDSRAAEAELEPLRRQGCTVACV
jgi:hypothetical protein